MKITKRQLRKIIREAVINETLPPHLKKHFNKDGSAKVHNPMGYTIKDVTPAGYGPDDSAGDEKLSVGSPVDTFDKVEALQPGDKITINKRASVVVDINDFNAVLTYVADGKATLKDLDYRLAVRYDDDPEDMLPEIEITYMGKGQLPQRLRQPPRKKGPGRSYSVMD